MKLLQSQEFSKERILELAPKELASIYYHDIFDYPLTSFELIKWATGEKVEKIKGESLTIKSKRGFCFLDGKEGMILKRVMRKRISVKKIRIAKKAARVLSFLPSVKMAAVTGALAMENANEDSDIDLMIITENKTLWITRGISLLLFKAFGLPVRRYKKRDEKDKLCLNMWFDESDLIWSRKERNIFTAHEIAQIVPLVNKKKTYEKFINKNSWLRDYWPNAVRIRKQKREKSKMNLFSLPLKLLEPLAYKSQYLYMKRKMTREIATATRAVFHPVDWTEIVMSRFQHAAS